MEYKGSKFRTPTVLACCVTYMLAGLVYLHSAAPFSYAIDGTAIPPDERVVMYESGKSSSSRTTTNQSKNKTHHRSGVAMAATKMTTKIGTSFDGAQEQAKVNDSSSSIPGANDTSYSLGLLPLPSFVSESNLTGHLDASTGRLTVNVDHTYAFWKNGQSKLCQLLRNMTKKASLADEIVNTTTPLLNMAIECEWLASTEAYGQGQESRGTLLWPWLEGYYPAPSTTATVDGATSISSRWPYDGNTPTQDEVCTDSYGDLRLDKVAHAIQSDMRKMTDTILLEKNFNTSTTGFVLDDVAIHFRCGDIMGVTKRSDYGIIQFTEYLKWIHKDNTSSIGILTQPFERKQNRREDGKKAKDCKQATYLLVDYLQQHFPQANISIRNDRSETLPTTYARLVAAKQSFTSLSSFGIFPVVGTWGEGYFQKGNRGVNNYANHIPNYMSNIHQMDAPMLSSIQIRRLGLNATLAWFVNGTMEPRMIL